MRVRTGGRAMTTPDSLLSMAKQIQECSAVEVAAMKAQGAILVDVRELGEWEAGHIVGSIHLPISELPQRWKELPDADCTVFVCRSGGRSEAAAEAFAAAGRSGCVNLLGGVQAWVSASQSYQGRVV